MKTLLYLIRHGETSMNRSGVLLGSTDSDLNELGISQAVELAKAFKNIELDIIVSSPLKRALKTAAHIAAEKDLDIKKDENLKEINFGIWEGMKYKEIIKLNPKEWEVKGENWLDFSPECGESFRNFYSRVSSEINTILDQYKGKRIAVISHDGVMKAIASKLLNMEQEGFWNFYFEHGKYSLFEIYENHCTVKKINI
jgi:alpha-ribazole phosphatase